MTGSPPVVLTLNRMPALVSLLLLGPLLVLVIMAFSLPKDIAFQGVALGTGGGLFAVLGSSLFSQLGRYWLEVDGDLVRRHTGRPAAGFVVQSARLSDVTGLTTVRLGRRRFEALVLAASQLEPSAESSPERGARQAARLRASGADLLLPVGLYDPHWRRGPLGQALRTHLGPERRREHSAPSAP